MKKHTKIYIDHFNYCEQDFIPCEICSSRAVDVHHIQPRGMGGSKTKDYIENLVGLCRQCHLGKEGDPLVGNFEGYFLVKTYRSMYEGKIPKDMQEIMDDITNHYDKHKDIDLLDKEMTKKYGEKKYSDACLLDQMSNTIGSSWECRECIIK